MTNVLKLLALAFIVIFVSAIVSMNQYSNDWAIFQLPFIAIVGGIILILIFALSRKKDSSGVNNSPSVELFSRIVFIALVAFLAFLVIGLLWRRF
jgi:uncharacterized YccA/Bax inhibitor family protein